MAVANNEFLRMNFAGINPSQPAWQCVNVANAWCRALGIEQFPRDAGDWIFDSHPDCDWITNAPTNVPKKGDIVIWKRTAASPGHVAIYVSGDVMHLNAFGQNYPTGSPAHIQPFNYTSPPVAGWFHPRILDPKPDPRDQQIKDLSAQLAAAQVRIVTKDGALDGIAKAALAAKG